MPCEQITKAAIAGNLRSRLNRQNSQRTLYNQQVICQGLTQEKQAAVGFEPTNNGFANRRLGPLGYAANLKRQKNGASGI